MTLLPERILPTKTYPFGDIRHLLSSVVYQEGIVDKGDFAVSQRGAGANLSVDVAAGAAYVQGDDVARQGVYEVINDGPVNVPVGPNSSGNPRIDTIALQVNDSSVASLSDDPQLVCLAGTPTPSATLANLSGKAALPNTCLPLAYVVVANGAGSILNANIGGYVDPGTASLGAMAGAPPRYALGRPSNYVPFAERYNGGAQSIPNNATTTLTLPNVLADNDGMAAVANTITVQTPGIYALWGHVQWSGPTGAATMRALLREVGSVELDRDQNDIAAFSQVASKLSAFARLGYGTGITLEGFQNSGAAVNTLTSNAPPALTATWVGF